MPDSGRLILADDIEEPVAIVMAADQGLRMLGKRMLQGVLQEGSTVLEAGSAEETLAIMTGEFNERIGLVLAFHDGDEQIRSLATALAVGDVKKESMLPEIPLFLVTDSTCADSDLQTFADFSFVDDIIQLPLRKSEVLAVLQRSMDKRMGLFDGPEVEAKARVMAEFADFYIDLAKIWLNDASRLCFATETGDARDEAALAEDANQIAESIRGIIEILEELKAKDLERISPKSIRKYLHNLNNKLNVVLGYPEFIKDSALPDPENEQILDAIETEAWQMTEDTGAIGNVCRRHRTSFWQDVSRSGTAVQKKERLEIPEGTEFCVIDDDPNILKITGKVIEAAGGTAVLINGKAALEQMICGAAQDLPQIKVFLLDNDLSGGVFGHQLIPLIRDKYPKALIIAHTADNLSLDADPDNEYRKAGAEVIRKRGLEAMSGVIRRKMRRE